MSRFSAMVLTGLVLVTAPMAAQQGRVRHSMASGAEPEGPAHGWALANAGTQRPSLAMLVAQGAATRFTPSTDLTVFQPAWKAAGSFTVSALFERLPNGSPVAAYGLTLGSSDQAPLTLAFLLRPDGSMFIQRGATRNARTALAVRVPLRPPGLYEREGALAPIDRLEVRVDGGQAEFFANGQHVALVPIVPGELDGHAGVHAAAGAAVLVSAFTLEGSVTAVRR